MEKGVYGSKSHSKHLCARTRKQCTLILSLIALLIVGIRPVLGAAPQYSTDVSFTATDSVSYDPANIAFDVNVTLEFETTYSFSLSGDLLDIATCSISLAPRSATLTAEYFIDCTTTPKMIGRKSVPLSEEGKELLGDSAPIRIPIEGPGMIEVVIHGRLFGNVGIDSTHYILLEWPNWGTKNISMTASAPCVPLLITKYRVFFAVTVSVTGCDPITRNTYLREISGDPSELVIPEFPLVQALYLIMIATLPAIAIYKRKSQK